MVINIGQQPIKHWSTLDQRPVNVDKLFWFLIFITFEIQIIFLYFQFLYFSKILTIFLSFLKILTYFELLIFFLLFHFIFLNYIYSIFFWNFIIYISYIFKKLFTFFILIFFKILKIIKEEYTCHSLVCMSPLFLK